MHICFLRQFCSPFSACSESLEYTSPYTQRFDRDTNLQLADVTVRLQSQIITVRIKSSKTDPFRVGAHIRVGATGNHLCPFTALIRYLNLRGGSPGPLFVFSDCSFLVRRHVATILRLTSPANQNVNTHSLRQGGAVPWRPGEYQNTLFRSWDAGLPTHTRLIYISKIASSPPPT